MWLSRTLSVRSTASLGSCRVCCASCRISAWYLTRSGSRQRRVLCVTSPGCCLSPQYCQHVLRRAQSVLQIVNNKYLTTSLKGIFFFSFEKQTVLWRDFWKNKIFFQKFPWLTRVPLVLPIKFSGIALHTVTPPARAQLGDVLSTLHGKNLF